MKDIKDSAKQIIKHCDNCLNLMKNPYVAHDDWCNETDEIVRLYGHIEWVMEEKRGRF